MVGPHRPPRRLGLLVKTWPKLSETFILEEVLGLERAGVALQLYALQAPMDEIQHDALDRVAAPVHYLPPATLRHSPALLGAQLREALRAPLRYARALGAAVRRRRIGDFLRAAWLADHLRREGIEHLHTHFISSPADIAEGVGALGIPFSISAHAKDIYLSREADLARKLRAARFTVTCTEYNRQTLAALAPDAIVHRMYHGVDAQRFAPTLRAAVVTPPLILAVGRLREKKGYDLLIEACRHLHAAGRRFRCEIVGYGDQAAALRAQIRQAGLASHIRLAGKLPREEVIARYAQARVFVQPSRIGADGDRDGIPNVVLEAMAMGLPVVSTRVSGIPEVVHHDGTGLLVAPERPAELAAAIVRLLDDPPLSETLAAAGRALVTRHFDNDRNLAVLRGLLEPSDECPCNPADDLAPADSVGPA